MSSVHSFVHLILVCLIIHTVLPYILSVRPSIHLPPHPSVAQTHSCLVSSNLISEISPNPVGARPSRSIRILPPQRFQSYHCSRTIHMHISTPLSMHTPTRTHVSHRHPPRPMPFVLPRSLWRPPRCPHASMSCSRAHPVGCSLSQAASCHPRPCPR